MVHATLYPLLQVKRINKSSFPVARGTLANGKMIVTDLIVPTVFVRETWVVPNW